MVTIYAHLWTVFTSLNQISCEIHELFAPEILNQHLSFQLEVVPHLQCPIITENPTEAKSFNQSKFRIMCEHQILIQLCNACNSNNIRQKLRTLWKKNGRLGANVKSKDMFYFNLILMQLII